MPPPGHLHSRPGCASRTSSTTALAAVARRPRAAAPGSRRGPASPPARPCRARTWPFRGDSPGRASPQADQPRQAAAASCSKLARKAPGSSGYYVTTIGGKSDAAIFDRNGGHSRKLASNEKLFTTITALHRLGPKSRIATRVKVRGRRQPQGEAAAATSTSSAAATRRSAPAASPTSPSRSARPGSGAIARPRDRRRQRLRPPPRRPRLELGPRAPTSPRSAVSSTAARPTTATPPRRPRRRSATGSATPASRSAARSRSAGCPRRSATATRSPSTSRRRSRRSSGRPTRTRSTSTPRCCCKRLWATPSRKGTTNGGVKAVERFAQRGRLEGPARDGSGLTAGNKASPRSVVRLLIAAQRDDELAKPLFKSLSIAGKDGTLGGRMEGSAAAGRCRGKTGTITGVSNLSGYCKTEERPGRLLAADERRLEPRRRPLHPGQDGDGDRDRLR